MLEDAYAAARESEARYGAGDGVRPLDGIPLLLKEEQPIAGRTIEEGSVLERGNIAEATHPVVERVFAAGAVVHGRSTTPEFSCAPFTHSDLWGITRNPWDTAMSPGGSSGGSGAALAAGADDAGDRLRHRWLDPDPGLAVRRRRLQAAVRPGARDAAVQLGHLLRRRPMGRSVADVALLQNVLAGPHPHDQASLRPAYVLPLTYGDIRGLRVALCINLGDYLVAPEVETNTRAAAAALESAGAVVTEVELPWRRDAWPRPPGPTSARSSAPPWTRSRASTPIS